MAKFALLGAILLTAAVFENLGDAAGYIIKSNTWGQYALAVGAMAVYGILTVTVGRSGWSFTQAFPLGYLFVYFIVGLGFGTLLEGRRPAGFQVLAAAFMLIGLLINVAGSVRSADRDAPGERISHGAAVVAPKPSE